jgi:hypothetical protein
MKKIMQMTNDIQWIYMIDSRSSSFLVFNKENKESLKRKKISLLHFLYGLQSLANNSNKDEIKVFKINNESYYLIEEPESKSFLIRTFILQNRFYEKNKISHEI